MGIEYSLRFAAPTPYATADVLKRIPQASECEPPHDGFELRWPGMPDEMPDAAVRPTADGAYFCVNGGRGAELLGIVLTRLVDEFGAVTIAELE